MRFDAALICDAIEVVSDGVVSLVGALGILGFSACSALHAMNRNAGVRPIKHEDSAFMGFLSSTRSLFRLFCIGSASTAHSLLFKSDPLIEIRVPHLR
jgi:hypothetical protein